jgi:polysaccharide deacetylase family protein (PEP-CTERM system associated)
MRYGDTFDKYNVFDSYLNKILDVLEAKGMKGTFFCVGGMATDFPEVVLRIEKGGHEIGCHSNRHTWLNKMTYEEVKEDTRIAVDALEQCIGKKVKSYRAPAFSIGESNTWAFEILAECGIERDASVFPAIRDFGGFPQFGHKTPTMVVYEGSRIKEFPICTIRFMGKELAYSGGGYFRFFPLGFIRKQMKRADYAMTYFHINDLVQEMNGVMTKEEYENYFKEPGTLLNRYKRYVKSNLGKKSAFDKLMKLVETTDFVNLEEADSQIDWGNQPLVIL